MTPRSIQSDGLMQRGRVDADGSQSVLSLTSRGITLFLFLASAALRTGFIVARLRLKNVAHRLNSANRPGAGRRAQPFFIL